MGTSPITVGSLFSGIGGFDLGLERAGMVISWQCEIVPFCRSILRTHWPNTKIYEDIKKLTLSEDEGSMVEAVDLIAAGVPCQDVSVAGKRAGLEGSRTGLFFEFARLLQEIQPKWFIFENVPGLFSSNGGRDFAEVLYVLMVKCGYGVAWRVLDSQFFGVAQRRRRVFIVGYLGVLCPAEILFESASSRWDATTGSKAGTDLADAITSGFGVTGILGDRARTLNSTVWKRHDEDTDTIVVVPIDGVSAGSYTNGVRDFAGLPEGLDSARYRALGNAVTVQVAEWIGRRIVAYESKIRL